MKKVQSLFFIVSLFIIVSNIPIQLSAQDPMFSQFYSNPLYLNPALAGTNECARIMFNYRNQWPSLDNNFTTYSASADRYFRGLSGGLGLIVNADIIDNNIMTTTRISLIYSVHIRLSRDVDLNAGFEGGFHQQKINTGYLIFPDMIDQVTGEIIPGNQEGNAPDNNQILIPDFAAGLMLGIKEKYFIGFASHHLIEPSLGFYNSGSDDFLYRKYTFHGGARFDLGGGSYNRQDNNFVLSPNILYQYQQLAQQINVGLYLEKNPLVIGAWYRYNIENTDGAIFMVGITQKWFKFGYSYDVTLSNLKGTTGGAHEISLALLVNCNKKRNKPGAIKCPEF